MSDTSDGHLEGFAAVRHRADEASLEPPPDPENRSYTHGSTAKPGVSPRAVVCAVFGGLLTGGLVCGYLNASASTSSSYELQSVAAEDLDSASQSLVAQSAANLVAGAKSCRQPLAFLTFRPNAPPGGTIRFQSGNYRSANVRLGANPGRIALPFPTAYAIGAGQIEIENTSRGVDVFLRPGFQVDATPGRTIINVHWKTDKPC